MADASKTLQGWLAEQGLSVDSFTAPVEKNVPPSAPTCSPGERLNDEGKSLVKRLSYQFWAESQPDSDKEFTLRHIEATLEAILCNADDFTAKE